MISPLPSTLFSSELSEMEYPASPFGPSLSDSLFNSLSPLNVFNVRGLIAVITGGGSGIGLMMATTLENNGAVVYILGRRRNVLEKAANENNKFGNIIPVECDITQRESLLAAVDVVAKRHGFINLLVNNAGIARNLYAHPLPSPTQSFMPEPNAPLSPPHSPSCEPKIPSIKAFQNALWDTGSSDDFADTFATNVTAIYYTTVAFLDLLHQGNTRQQRNELPPEVGLPRPPYHTSHVLSVSSSGSFRLDAKILSPSYTLSKIACTHLGKLLANLLAPWGIRSNVLAPGVWPSEMTNSLIGGDQKLNPNALADMVPLRRTGTTEDMAGTILFLASRAGAYVNGAVWLVDGGRIGCVPSSY